MKTLTRGTFGKLKTAESEHEMIERREHLQLIRATCRSADDARVLDLQLRETEQRLSALARAKWAGPSSTRSPLSLRRAR